MKKIVKQALGTDVSQNELVVCLGRMYDDWIPELYARKTFSNNSKGFCALMLWVKKLMDPSIPLRFVMEATGVYHELFAYYLEAQGLEVSIVLPNKISNYMRTLDTKTITDKTASDAITLFGLERKLDLWKKPKDIFKQLRQLTREREQVVFERTIVKNQLHAEQTEAMPNRNSLVRIQKRIEVLNNQDKEITTEIRELVNSDKDLTELSEILCTIPGIGQLTFAIIIAETNGFDLIRNKRQLTSYAGLDVKEKSSGTSVKGTPAISKKGNKYLRKALHLPALSAIRHDEHFKAIFIRLVSKHGIKMKAAVAVQRKLLELLFTLYKTKKVYDKDFLKKKEEENNEDHQNKAA